MLRPHTLPPRTDGGDGQAVPGGGETCGTRQDQPQAGKFGEFVGCSNYTECRRSPARSRRPRSPAADRVIGGSRDRSRDVHVKGRTIRPLHPARRAEGLCRGRKTAAEPGIQGTCRPGRFMELELDTKTARRCRREIGKHPNGRADHSRDRPLRHRSCARKNLYAPRGRRRGVFDSGQQPRVTLIAGENRKRPERPRCAPIRQPLASTSLGGVAVKNGRYGAYAPRAAPSMPTFRETRRSRTITLDESHRPDRRNAPPMVGQAEARRHERPPEEAAADPNAPKPAEKNSSVEEKPRQNRNRKPFSKARGRLRSAAKIVGGGNRHPHPKRLRRKARARTGDK